MSRVVLVHGIGQQFRGPESLRADWLPALQDGMRLAGAGRIPASSSVAMAFYGDIFRPTGRGIGEPDLDASDVTDEFDQELLLAWWKEAAAKDSAVPGPYADTRVRTPYIFQRALNALGHSSFFTRVAERALILDLRQVRRYLSEPALRCAIIERVAACVSPRTRVIVAHSLGSVAAYEALCAHPEWPIDTFVSLGSPLGLRRLVFDRLRPAPMDGCGAWPGQIWVWVNIADRGDVVAAEKRLSRMFGPNVADIAVHNGSHAHDVRPYLTARETGAAILAAVGR